MAFVFSQCHNMTGAVGWFTLKQLLVTAGWLVKSSGDGLSAFSSSGDVITSGGTGAGGFANNNAWVRLQMPLYLNVRRELLIQLSGTSTVNLLNYSYSAGFTGGSPSATVAPTATDSQNIRKVSTVMFTADNSFHLYMGADNAAPYGFYMFEIPNGNPNSTQGGGLILECMTPGSTPPGEIEPFAWFNASGFSGGTIIGGTVGKAYFGKGTSAEQFSNCTPIGIMEPSGGNFSFPSEMGTNPHSQDEEVHRIPWGWVSSAPSTEATGVKGLGYMMMWNGWTKSRGARVSLATPGDRICLEDVNFPWDGSRVFI